MIFDEKNRLNWYTGISANIDRAIAFLQETDLDALPAGRCEIDGQRVFALVQERETVPRSKAKWESHHRYIDLQYLVYGAEFIGFQTVGSLHPQGDFIEDVRFYQDNQSGFFVPLEAGQFVICFPHDVHMPLVAKVPKSIKKVVIKIEGDGRSGS